VQFQHLSPDSPSDENGGNPPPARRARGSSSPRLVVRVGGVEIWNRVIYARERETEELKSLAWRLTRVAAPVTFYLISGVCKVGAEGSKSLGVGAALGRGVGSGG